MSSKIQNTYQPDYVSPPGETLLETLEALGMSQAELAQRMGRPKKTINEIVQGKAALTPETALQLELVLGVPANFWNRREQQFREFLARQEVKMRLSAHLDWLTELPIKTMVQRGWVKQSADNVQQICEILRFYGVSSPDQWRDVWNQTAIAFRKSKAYEGQLGPVSAWLRQGEIEAQHIDCGVYDPQLFRSTLAEIRTITPMPPEQFRPLITDKCAAAGVAVVFVPELPHAPICGATRWLSSRKALIQLSLRYKTDDHLWFTFFHEAGHITLHGKRAIFLEGQVDNSEQEAEADMFAAEQLIPLKAWHTFLESKTYTSKTGIKTFADSLGIAPGIVVGRLQHEKYLPYTHCNELKRRFAWKAE